MDNRLPRIKDVALVAGVSTATVSRALSHPDKVSPKARESVLAAVAQTGYSINVAARNLRRQQTGSIVVLVPHLSNPFFSVILSQIANVATQAGLNVLVVDTRQPEGADRQIAQYLHNNRADGLIVLDGNLPEDMFDGGDHTNRPPVIFACEWVEGHEQPTVTIDNRLGAILAIEHLIGLGHRRIGHVTGPLDNVLTRQRMAGFRDALLAAGLDADDRWLIEGDFTLPSGIAAARRWLEMEERPTGIFLSSDAMACGFMSELHRHGIRVPEDVSIVGFDDIEISAHFIPPITTIHQPRERIGETAANMLLAMINDPANAGTGEGVSRVLPIGLIVRGSTSPL
jgi:LacI family transcriptional regulator, repressor for deo operon, udp, cdd, tsx, nupC, and nupG